MTKDGVEAPPEEIPENLTGTVVRGAGYAATGFILFQALTLVAYLILARLATPAEFGQFAAAAILVNVGLLFTESGMMAAVVHRRDRIDEAASTATAATALAGLGFALGALAVSPLIGKVFHDPEIGTLAAGMSGLLFLRSLQVVPEALLQRRFSFLRRMVVEPAQVTAFGIVSIILVSNGAGAWGLVAGYYASAITDVLLSWILVGWRPRLRLISYRMWRELASYGIHMVTSSIVLRAYQEVPTLLLGRFTGAAPLGQFTYANRISGVPFGLLLAAAAYVIFPALSRITDDGERFVDAFLRSLRSVSTLAFLLGFLLVALGTPATVIIFGDQWYAAGEAVIPLGVSVVFLSITALITEAFAACGRPDIILPSHTVTGIVGTVAMIALLHLGLIGVAIGIAIGALAGFLYETKRLRDLYDIPIRAFVERTWPPAVAALAMTAALVPLDRLLLDPSAMPLVAGILTLGAETLLGIAVFTGALTLVSPSTMAEAREAIRLARGRGR